MSDNPISVEDNNLRKLYWKTGIVLLLFSSLLVLSQFLIQSNVDGGIIMIIVFIDVGLVFYIRDYQREIRRLTGSKNEELSKYLR